MKSILVPGLNAIASSKALGLALDVARIFDGRIECLHIHPDVHELARYTASLDVESGVFSGQIWDSLVAADKSCLSRSRKVFDAFCKREDLGAGSRVRADWHEVEGNSREQTIQEAYYNDLVVFARPPKPEDLTAVGVGDDLVECGRPLLLAPSTACPHPISNVVIAWKDTASSARSVSAAMPLLARAEQIHVVQVNEGSEEERHGPAPTERLVDYLHRQGIGSRVNELES